MAKLGFAKLGLKLNSEIKTIKFNEQNIEVKQYLPTEQKIDIITKVIELSHDGQNNFSNPLKVAIYTALEVIMGYTNISFTDKQREDVLKTYDLLNSNGLLQIIIEAIPKEEYNKLVETINTTIDAIYKYQNSVLGILDSVKTDYNNLELDATKIQEAIGDPENLALLKDIITKLG